MSKPTKSIWSGEIKDTPLGAIWTAVSEQGLVAVSLWPDRGRFEALIAQSAGQMPVYEPQRVTAVARQIRQYLHKERETFELTIDWSLMTPFQALALQKVSEVGYGRLTTYGAIAEQLGKPGASRAVGRANATNPIPLIIPCHRVLGSDGKLHGYGAPGGLETKAWLLRLEGSWLI